MTKEIPYGYCHCGCGQKTKLSSFTNRTRGVKQGEPNRFIAQHQNNIRKTRPLYERFWSKVAITANPDKCWEWTAALSDRGYGKMQIGGHKGKWTPASRIAYELTYGEIPDGLFVLHKCDNRLCCNPGHLFLGTQLDNMRDAVRKGRVVHGENHYKSKLTDKQIEYIRAKHSAGDVTQSDLAKEMGVSQSCISGILRGTSR